MTKQEHIMYLLGQLSATLSHITTTSYRDMPEAQRQMASAHGLLLREMDEIFNKPDMVTPNISISSAGEVKIWTS